jgi:hypothetical protein
MSPFTVHSVHNQGISQMFDADARVSAVQTRNKKKGLLINCLTKYCAQIPQGIS